MNLKSAIREITPPILRKTLKALLGNKPTKPNTRPFSGIYKTLSDVPKTNFGYYNENFLNSIFEDTKTKLNNARSAQFLPDSHIENNIKNLFPLLIAALLHNKKNRITIFDFGGGMGTSFIDCLSYLSSDRISFHLLDTKPTCDLGKKLFKDVPNIKFYDCLPEIVEDIDIVLMGSSLQYVNDYQGTLLKLFDFKAEYIFMTDYFMGRMKTFATSQVNMQGVTIPMWIFNYEEIINLFEEHNYKLLYKTPNYQPYHDLSNFPKEFALRDSYNFLFAKKR